MFLLFLCIFFLSFFFFFNDTATTEIYTLSLHDALPICGLGAAGPQRVEDRMHEPGGRRSEEHTSELQSLRHLVCRLLLEKKKKKEKKRIIKKKKTKKKNKHEKQNTKKK